MENPNQTAHREWLNKVRGTKIPEIIGAKPMVGLEQINLEGLVVSDEIQDWEQIKQPIIPLAPAETDNQAAKEATRQLRMLRAFANAPNGILVLVKDEQLGGEGQWALSILNPIDLKRSPEELRRGMEVTYSIGQVAVGSTARAALLAVTGKQTI